MARDLLTSALFLAGGALASAALLRWAGYSIHVLMWGL